MPFVTDTFTDTNGVDLSAHTPDVGTSWASLSGTDQAEIQSNRVQMTSHFATARYACAPSASDADYFVEVDLVHNIQSGWAGHFGGVFARATYPGGGSMSLTTGYEAKWNEVNNAGGSAGIWQLTSWSGGVEGAALATSADSWTTGTRTVRLTVNGTSIVVAVGGVDVISVTNSDHSAAGACGIMVAGGLLNGIWLDNFTAEDTLGGGGGGGPVGAVSQRPKNQAALRPAVFKPGRAR